MNILVIDNDDSFTYNLVQYLGELKAEPQVFRNDAISVARVRELAPQGILISPGPGRPQQAGITLSVIHELAGEIPILGVCLGHQAIGEAFGGDVVQAPELMHGKTSEIFHASQGVFAGLESPFRATRYHSLIVDEHSVPDCLQITARTGDGLIMGLQHRNLPVFGVQFHPESLLTDCGKNLLGNFLQICTTSISEKESI